MRKKLTSLVLALALLAGAQMGLFTPQAAEADTCQQICFEDFELCLCCSTCCRSSSGQVICSPGACICP
jgi:hypothetical protein